MGKGKKATRKVYTCLFSKEGFYACEVLLRSRLRWKAPCRQLRGEEAAKRETRKKSTGSTICPPLRDENPHQFGIFTKKIHGQRFGLHAGRGDIARQFRMFTASSMGSSPPSTEMKPLCQFRIFTEKTPRSMGRLSVRRYVPTAYCSASK